MKREGKKMKKLFVLLMFLFVFGCAGMASQQYSWTKPGGSNEQFQRDKYECSYNAKMFCYRSQGWLFVDICEKDHTDMCLKSRGWRYEPVGQSVPQKNTSQQPGKSYEDILKERDKK